jgi:preprotein translocase subunit SecE
LTDKKDTNAPLQKKESKPVEKKERKEPNFVTRYYRETAGELRKVNWPTRQEATNMTILVVIVLIIMTIFLGTVDGLAAMFITWIVGL